MSLACWALRPTEASTDCRLPAICWSVAACSAEPWANWWALEFSSLLAVDTEAVISRIWLITSANLSTTELTCVGQIAQLVAIASRSYGCRVALVKLLGDLDDLEQGPDEPAAEVPAQNEGQQ